MFLIKHASPAPTTFQIEHIVGYSVCFGNIFYLKRPKPHWGGLGDFYLKQLFNYSLILFNIFHVCVPEYIWTLIYSAHEYYRYIMWYIHNKPKLSEQLTHINSWSHESLRQLQRWAGWSPSPCRSKCWLFDVICGYGSLIGSKTQCKTHHALKAWPVFRLVPVRVVLCFVPTAAGWQKSRWWRWHGRCAQRVETWTQEAEGPSPDLEHSQQLNMLKWTFTSSWWFGTMEFYFFPFFLGIMFSIYWV